MEVALLLAADVLAHHLAVVLQAVEGLLVAVLHHQEVILQVAEVPLVVVAVVHQEAVALQVLLALLEAEVAEVAAAEVADARHPKIETNL